MTRALSEEGFSGDFRGLVQTYTIPCQLNLRKCPPCRINREKGGATVVKDALKSSSCGSEAEPIECGTSGQPHPGPKFPPESSKAVQSKFARRFRKVRCSKSASTIGVIQLSAMNREATIMKLALAPGTSHRRSGRKRHSQMFTTDPCGSDTLIRRLWLRFGSGFHAFSLTMDKQNFEICTHLSDKSVRPASACKIEVPCSSPNNLRSS
jgi:hypothetical protein